MPQMVGFLKKFVPDEFRQYLKRHLFAHQDMKTRLANLRRAGFSPTGVIDGGAYRGEWTKAIWSVWPKCPSIMIEPLPTQFRILNSLAAATPGSRVAPTAIGDKKGEVHFRVQETNSAIVSGNCLENAIAVPSTTLDALLEEAVGFLPNLLKLDLQGHELKALAGCQQHLKRFEVVILEVSILRIGDVPIFSEVDQFMIEHQYRLYDLLPQYYRPRDGALWQMDVFYVRDDSGLIASRSWD